MDLYELAKEHGIDAIVKIEAEQSGMPLKQAMQHFIKNIQEYGITQGALTTIEKIRQYSEARR